MTARTITASVLATALALTACAAGGGTAPPTTATAPPVVAAAEVATLPDGTAVRAVGFLMVTADGVRLCDALAESYPPVCGGAGTPVEVDPAVVVGLSRPFPPDAGFADVAWSDFPLAVVGIVRGGRIVGASVDQPVTEVTSGDLALRVTWSTPLRSGGPVTWAVEVVNRGEAPALLSFRDGKEADVELHTVGRYPRTAYRWSDGKVFTQALWSLELAAGDAYTAVLRDELDVDQGTYRLVARLAAEGLDDVVVEADVEVIS